MNVIVIGLGSMGKRRIRNLIANGVAESDIVGYDLRDDRRTESEDKYGIRTIDNLEEIKISDFDAMIISVPPDLHIHYMMLAVDSHVPCFVEASVVDDGMEELERNIKDKNGVVCPSCTLRFHPAIKTIKKIVDNGYIGKISHFSYHSGQYLPDWHPWEDINDFYVSKTLTGGGREIVPFELTWLNWVFGNIHDIKGFYRKTIDINAPIDDTYVSAIEYESGVIGTLIVDVVSRKALRHLTINGDAGQIVWDWDADAVRLYSADGGKIIEIHNPKGHSEFGYNENIIEEMYIEEIRAFLNKVSGQEEYPNSIEADHAILRNLYMLESNDERR